MLDDIIKHQEANIKEMQTAGASIYEHNRRAQHELALRHAIAAYCDLLKTQVEMRKSTASPEFTGRITFPPAPDIKVNAQVIQKPTGSDELRDKVDKLKLKQLEEELRTREQEFLARKNNPDEKL